MQVYRIQTLSTLQLHRWLSDQMKQQRAQFGRALRRANSAMREQRITVGQTKQIEVALSALLLSEEDEGRLRRFSEKTHRLIEDVLKIVTASPELLKRYFPSHQRVFPFLAKTRGLEHLQAVSRYDVAIEPGGRLRILELNTSCPGGFLISEAISLVSLKGLRETGGAHGFDESAIGSVLQEDLIEGLLRAERDSGIEQGAVAVVCDENELSFELDLIAAGFRRRLRDVYLGDARNLEYRDGRLYGNGRYISLIYNKFRVSTPHSENHCWRDGFEKRYDDWLRAQQDGAVVSINNLYGIALAEDKSLLALFQDEEVLSQLTPKQQNFAREHIPWTARLIDQRTTFDGNQIDLLPYIRENRDRFVIKPDNEGRGFRVVVGKYASQSEWEQACEPDPTCPSIVQEYVQTQSLPVICRRDDELSEEEMFITLGLAVICGQYRGLVSRVSANPVTNVAREGFIQAVFVQGGQS